MKTLNTLCFNVTLGIFLGMSILPQVANADVLYNQKIEIENSNSLLPVSVGLNLSSLNNDQEYTIIDTELFRGLAQGSETRKDASLESKNSEKSLGMSEFKDTLPQIYGKSESKIGLAPYQVLLVTLGFVGFVISLINIFLSLRHRKADREKSIIDDFWLREIIIPKTIEPMEELLLNNKYRGDGTSKPSESDMDELAKILDDLKYKISFANLISESLMLKLEYSLDELLITVIHHHFPYDVYNVSNNVSGGNNAGDPFFNCYKSMLNHLMTTHKNIKMKEVLSI